jgi:hypothetical protein
MNTLHKGLLAAVAIALAVFALPTPSKAATTEVTHFRVTNGNAFAYFSSRPSDTSGQCVPGDPVQTDAFVASSSSGTFVGLDEYNTCTNTLLLEAFGYTDTPAIQVSRQLDAATLATTVSLTDYSSCSSFPCAGQPYDNVSVDLTWTGTGRAIHIVDGFHTHAPGFTTTSHDSGTFRPATASGAISVGTTNFALLPLQFAQIGLVKSSTVAVYRYGN